MLAVFKILNSDQGRNQCRWHCQIFSSKSSCSGARAASDHGANLLVRGNTTCPPLHPQLESEFSETLICTMATIWLSSSCFLALQCELAIHFFVNLCVSVYVSMHVCMYNAFIYAYIHTCIVCMHAFIHSVICKICIVPFKKLTWRCAECSQSNHSDKDEFCAACRTKACPW